MAILLASCHRDPQVLKQKYYNHGLQLIQKGRLKEATLELLNALKIDRNFAEAASVLAELQYRQGNYRQAYQLLQQAVAAKPDYLPPHKGLAQIYRLSGKLEEASKETDYVLEHSPDDIEALLNLGAIKTLQKKLKEAEGAFNRVLELQPSHVAALLALASVKKSAGDVAGAERYLKLALERNPRSTPVYLALLKFYIVAGRSSDAEPLFSQALRVSHGNMDIWDAQLGYYLGLNRFPEAETVAKRIQASHGNDAKYWTTLADFYVRTNDWRKAQSELTRLRQLHNNDPVIVHKLIEVYFNLNDRKSAEALNAALLKANPKDSYGHLFRGRIYLANGDIDNALVEFNETHKYQPDLPALHYWYAQAFSRRGQLQEAQRSLETALKYDPGYREARLSLAEVQNQSGALDAAAFNARKLLQNNPSDVQALFAYSQSLISKKEYAEAGKIVRAVADRTPQNAEAHRQLGILALAKNDLPAARKEFKRAWDLQPRSKRFLEGTLMTYVAEKQPAAAVGFLQEELPAHPQEALLYHELAQIYLLQNKRPEAIASLSKAVNLPSAGADSAILLADLYAQDKKPQPAADVLAGAMRKDPRNAALLIAAGVIFEKVQRWDEARAAYERVLQADSGNALAKNNLAALLAERGGNMDVALKLAQEAKEALGDNLQVTNTIGWIYYKKGIYQMAWNYLKECAGREPGNPMFQYQFGLASWRAGKDDDARQSLLKALKLDPNLPEAKDAREILAHL